MNRVYFRNVGHDMNSDSKAVFRERLDLNIDQENRENDGRFRHCSFTFSSQLSGVANVQGHVSFSDNDYEPTGLSHSSGRITDQSLTNFKAFDSLLLRLQSMTQPGVRFTDEQIFNDGRLQQILKNNNWVAYSGK